MLPDALEGPDDAGKLLSFGLRRRLRLVRQTEVSECGLACLAMVAGWHGSYASLADLRRRFSLSLKGVTLLQLMDMAQTMGLAGRAVRLELDELRQLKLPCIVHVDLDHFVVLASVGRSRVTLYDPAVGIRTIDLDAFGEHFTGVAVELSAGPDFRRQKPGAPVSIRSLGGSIRGLRKGLVQVFCLALVLELFALLSPQFLQLVVDQVLADGDHQLLGMLGISFLILLLLQTAVTAMRTWLLVWIGTQFNLSWTGRVFQHLLRLPQEYFFKRHLGDIVSRFNAVTSIQQTLTSQFVGGLLDGLMALITLCVLFAYNAQLAFVIGFSVLLYTALRALYFSSLKEANLSQIVVNAKQQTTFMESVRGSQTLRLYNQGARRTSVYLNTVAESLNTSVGVQKLNLVFSSMHGLVSGGQRIAVLWLGAWLALRGEFTAGSLMAFVAYADQFTSRASSLVDYVMQYRLLHLQTERLADIALTAAEPHTEGVYRGPAPTASIEFDQVSFRYADGEPWVLRNCSFRIEAGEAVVFVGPSGCGKSTIARLALGLLEPQTGTLRIGGIDLKHLGKNAYRDIVASVMQDDRLFGGSIEENISFFEHGASMDKVIDAARRAQIHTDIMAMPMGYRTRVGDMGSALSGGQQQRLWMARLFYRNPAIAVLDEATSHLDPAAEQRCSEEFSRAGMTRLIVAHRVETISSADRIMLVTQGEVRELKRQQ
ncbi:MAG TPA: peptidase domain-containing ABC transporter [Rhodanobacter sp.]|jgi:ATP-binding cassette subfamily B protein RaxB|nr:peptidase domain-containing ABC transporter [Rhodanobacter sp.]